MKEDISYILETLRFKTSIYRDKHKRNLSFNDDEYYASVLNDYITQLETNWKELKKWLEDKLASDIYSDGMYYGFKICLSKLNEIESGNNDTNNR